MTKFDINQYLNSGSTLLNLALTDNPYCAFRKGCYYFVVGDSMAGKSYFAMQQFAEATYDKNFDDYLLIQDNPEDGTLMDIAHHFGEAASKRIKPPSKKGSSITAEEMYTRFQQKMEKRPVIQVVDSMDALTTLAELKKSKAIASAVENDEDVAGIMADGKAKVNSQMLRQVLGPMQRTGSILFILSQTRDNLGNSFGGKTRSGGRALRFYATSEIWFSIIKTLTKAVRGEKHEYGVLVKIQVKKTRTSAVRHSIVVPILHGYGYDDIGSCVDFLVRNKQWKMSGKNIESSISESCSRTQLIGLIEDDEEYRSSLVQETYDVWNDIQEKLKPQRKPRYE